MKLKYSIALLFVVIITLSFVSVSLRSVRSAQTPTDPRLQREALYRLNNIGVALMEQFKHKEAMQEFTRALERDPKFGMAQTNLAIAAWFERNLPAALEAAKKAVALSPDSPHAHYIYGIVLRNEKQYEQAVAEFSRVLQLDPKDAYANLQIGQIYVQNRQYDLAIKAFTLALESEPYNKTAAYNLANAFNRSGKTQDGQKWLTTFQQLAQSGYATSLGNSYGEQGRYAEGVISTGAESELVSKDAPNVKFVDATTAMNLDVIFANKSLSSALGRRVTKTEFENEATKRELVNPFSATIGLFDADNDGKLDVLAAGIDANSKPFVKLLRNDSGKFSDVSEKSKLTVNGFISGAVFGNFDNDEKNTQDVLLFGYNTLALWRNNGDGSFTEVTKDAQLPTDYKAWAMTAAFTDADHDGDLDLFVGNFADLSKWTASGDSAMFPDDFAGTPNKLFRNNGVVEGKVTFTDITDKAKLSGGANKTTAVVCTDYDNHRDVDFFVVNYNAPAQLFANQRDGSFREVAEQAGITGIKGSLRYVGVAAGDLNKDGFTDFCTTIQETQQALSILYLSDGRGRFTSEEQLIRVSHSASGDREIPQILDYNNDGLLDVVSIYSGSLMIEANVGGGKFRTMFDVSGTGDWRTLASGDLNADGAVDLLTIDTKGSLLALRNEGASKNYVALNLTGRSSNRSGIGTKAELRSGSLSQKLELYSSSPAPAPASLIFGLGYRTQVDALKLTWPAGIVQSELAVKTAQPESIEELDRKGTSCPLLYAWNGSEYKFVTDFLGGCAIGARTPGQTWNVPDTDEYVLVTSEQLKPRDGVYSLRMNNQLEEVIFFDAVKLLAIDHPATTDIYPNEKLMPGPPFTPFKIWSVRNPRPPVSAVDDKGNNILPLIEKIDDRYPTDFERLRFKGYAKEHAIELDLGKDVLDAKQVVLLLHGWIDYADSTANLAASQAGVTITPPSLQVKNARGEWQTVIDSTGFPAGLPKTMTIDLSGKFLCKDARVRLVTSMRLYWDQILVSATNETSPVNVTTLAPMRADLRWRGFPREIAVNDFGLKTYDYRVIEATAPWKAHLGNYTRFGDVRELLLAPEDMYVITRNGDEMQVDFDARKLPPLRDGWKRDFLIYVDGFGKDMDLNSARPETVGELPFHKMKSYPPAPGESYPTDKAHQDYLRTYNTRTVSQQTEARWRGVR